MNHSPLSSWADRSPWRWPVITIAVVLLLCGAWALTQAQDEIAYMQAIEDDRVDAAAKEQQKLDRQKDRQELCGGPEATVVERADGGFDCYSKRGYKTFTLAIKRF